MRKRRIGQSLEWTKEKIEELSEALHYLKVGELRVMCEGKGLPSRGKKKALIHRIVHFLLTGAVVQEPPLPEASRAKKGEEYPLSPQTLILQGSYKNDAVTRAFMKTLVGEHFHFTVSGLDWIQERWSAGNPPTYAEFAAFWKQDRQKQEGKKPKLKEEWAYLSFIRRLLDDNPTISREEMMGAWEKERQAQVNKAQRFMKNV